MPTKNNHTLDGSKLDKYITDSEERDSVCRGDEFCECPECYIPPKSARGPLNISQEAIEGIGKITDELIKSRSVDEELKRFLKLRGL